jgi:hypothetical protein
VNWYKTYQAAAAPARFNAPAPITYAASLISAMASENKVNNEPFYLRY